MDAEHIGNWYWMAGFFQSALALLDVGNFFATKGDTLAKTFQEAAAKDFFRGKELISYCCMPENEKLLAIILGD